MDAGHPFISTNFIFSSDLLASHPGTYACSNAIWLDLVDIYTYEKSGRGDWNE